jgi:DNA adenine methylase
VLNDIDEDLINFYRVVDVAHRELILFLQRDLVSRRLFHLYLDELRNKKDISNVRRAKLFYYTLKASFGGKRGHFGVTTCRPPSLNLKEVDSIIDQAHQRLSRVTIECLDFRKLIPRYDRSYTLFYCDPPYRVKSSKSYYRYFTDNDYIDLRDLLLALEGKFLLSINDDPFIRELFKDFLIEEIGTTYNIISTGTKQVQELLIRNYDV